jgi:hypothetical protein
VKVIVANGRDGKVGLQQVIVRSRTPIGIVASDSELAESHVAVQSGVGIVNARFQLDANVAAVIAVGDCD